MDKKNDAHKQVAETDINDLSRQVARVAKALEKQNNLRGRFVIGVTFGVGTAIGASVIATFIIIFVARLLAPIGIDFMSTLYDTRQILQKQIEMQTPQ